MSFRGRLSYFLILAAAFLPTLASSQARRSAIWFEGARLIIGDKSPVIESSAFLVEGDSFTWVGKKGERQPPANAVRVDLTGKTVMPTLIDGHNHIGLVNEKDGSNTKANYTRANLIDQLQRYAYYGTAAAMSMGLEADQELAYKLRDEVIPNAAKFLTVGKGIAATSMAGPPGEARLGIPYGAATPEEGRQHVRELHARGVHFVKFWVDDREGTVPKLKPEVYRAIIDEAHKNGMETLAHLSRTSALADAKDLLKSGVDGFVHTVRDRDVDDEYIALVKAHPKVWTGPNIPSPDETEEEINALAETLPASTIATMRRQLAARKAAGNKPNELFELHCRNVKRIHDAGMIIGLGTDATGDGFGAHQQIEYYTRCGFTTAEAIQAGTSVNAKVLGLTRMGAVAAGKEADFVVLDANPLENIANTHRINKVYLRGAEVDRAGLRRNFLAAAPSDSRLAEAARSQDLQQVRALLNQHADVNARSGDGSTALLWAAHWNAGEVAGLLIRAGADANAANDFRMTPLSEACTNGSAPFVDLLLKAGANPNTPVATGVPPIMTCARTGSADAIRKLIAGDADVNAKEPAQNQTALMWAAAEHHPDVVRILIEAKADLRAHTKNGFTALHFAAREGDIESARLLLAAGVDINIRSQPGLPPTSGDSEQGGLQPLAGRRAASATSSDGATPLLVATMRAQVPLALFLLDHGADPNVADAGLTPLHWAAATWENGTANPVYGFEEPMAGIPDRQAKLRLVKSLLAHGANPNARITRPKPAFAGGYTDVVGATPFLLASATDDVEMMRILLAAGADPNLVTATNTTALMAATALNHLVGESPVTEQQAIEAVKLLLDVGVSAGGATTFNENALFGPAYRGWNTLLELLVENGADVNVVSKAGVTPWLAASGFGDRLGGVLYNKAGADILAKHGADPKLGRPCQAQNKCR